MRGSERCAEERPRTAGRTLCIGSDASSLSAASGPGRSWLGYIALMGDCPGVAAASCVQARPAVLVEACGVSDISLGGSPRARTCSSATCAQSCKILQSEFQNILVACADGFPECRITNFLLF